MKRILSVLVISALFTACNDSSINVEAEADSLNTKLEHVGEKIEEKAEQAWDTTKAKASDIKDKAEREWDSLKVNKTDRDTIIKQ